MRNVLILLVGVICIGCGKVSSQVNLNTAGVIEKKEENLQIKKDFEEFLIKAKKIQGGKDE
jgi:patatin-like phospholipase/acyl hydrolase